MSNGSVGAAAHLGIDLAEYDARIRTFIPDYDEMLDVAAALVLPSARRIVDLGTGTGALAARCLAHAPRARLVGIDADPEIAQVAAERLGSRASFRIGDFTRVEVPRCDTIVASLALHHVGSRRAKTQLYSRLRRALTRGGQLIIVDCQPASDARVAATQREAWRQHLQRAYTRAKGDGFLRAWSKEDTYVPLAEELDLMRRGGLPAEVIWRKGMFAVIRAASNGGGAAL